jgi:acetyl/propionyl-CoA carboxylase alpha subunit
MTGPTTGLLIANRGEIAIRIARAAAALSIRSVAIFSEDDAHSLHVRRADTARQLHGRGPAAYLDMRRILDMAVDTGCSAIHPGYGFLSENAEFARLCEQRGIVFVGPRADALALFGDKGQARALAASCGVPVPHGTAGGASLREVEAFFATLPEGGAAMIKAVAGGGGRGMRVVCAKQDIARAYASCASEAQAAFGQSALYVEELIGPARHIEVQVIGDHTGAVVSLGERECSLQRRHQKLIEIAPSPGLGAGVRAALTEAALGLARQAAFDNLGTFEFLVRGDGSFAFIEANPRLQVEHTVTEAVTGVDLVASQIRIALGETIAALGLDQAAARGTQGMALQMRVNMETVAESGEVTPSGGTLRVFEPASGPGVRVDSFGYAGYATSPAFDSLLAKVIVHTPSAQFADLIALAARALRETRIEGLHTNIPLLQAVLRHPDVLADRVHTGFIEDEMATLARASIAFQPLPFDSDGVRAGGDAVTESIPPGTVALRAPMGGRIVSLEVAAGQAVHAGQPVAVIEAMKAELVIRAGTAGLIHAVTAVAEDIVSAGQTLLFIAPGAVSLAEANTVAAQDPDAIRPDLAEMLARRAALQDAARPEATARRRASGQRTARENLAAMCDPGSFLEYGDFAIAAQRGRRSLEELRRISPADGLVAGIGTVNAAWFGDQAARCMALAYDYTVLAGTQGIVSHKKLDRMLQLAGQWRLPVVLFAEGGGGRPGDTDHVGVTGLDSTSFLNYARLNGRVPLVGIVSGRCFAGNAALLGCSDVIIATANASIGMAGPAMIEGGGLGVHAPDDIGPARVQSPNGVIDILVPDEAAAVAAARQYLGYFQGNAPRWNSPDPRALRHLVPERRLRSYDMRAVIAGIADLESVLELRAGFAAGMITALIRVEGRPLGVIANNPMHLGGAIDADAADKAARFMQLCDAFGLPILSLCDTPGFMVGPDAERTALVRHVARMFVNAGSLTVPVLTVITRKGYGLGAMAMGAGSFHAPVFTVAWPSGELGGMGLEGAVRLAYRSELAAIADPAERQAEFDRRVAQAYERGKALNVASFLEIDTVIDPAETRTWISGALRAAPSERRAGARIDSW